MMIGLRTGMVTMRRSTGRQWTRPRSVPVSSRVRITGETSSTWNRMICATNEASPST